MILRFKNKGAKVAELQSLLGLKPDGVFGPNTLAAVKKFQENNGLKPDGIVGPKTWEILVKPIPVNIIPVYDNDTTDDDSDPEERMSVDELSESLPTSKHLIELINLINTSSITRNIDKLVFHCTATSQTATVAAIQKYWKEVKKWNAPGYHIIIKPDGSWTQLLDFNKISNGVAGMNSHILNICYIGGVDSKGNPIDNRTKDQNKILETIYRTFKHKMPLLTFHGHYEFTNKACPSFNVKNWIDSLKTI